MGASIECRTTVGDGNTPRIRRNRRNSSRRSVPLSGTHERLETLVIRLTGRRDRVAAAADHLALGGEGSGQGVADGLEGGGVPAGEDEHRKIRGAQHLQWDLRLPGRSLPLEQLDAVEELLGQLVRRVVRGSRPAAEEAEEVLRGDVLRMAEEALPVGDHL